MLRLFGAVATAALVAASDPEVSVACSGDTNITISIAYTKPNVQLLNFASGICNETSAVQYSQNATSNEVTINMNMRDCGLRSQSRVTRGLRTILFDNVAELALGRHDDAEDKNMIFYSNKVNLTCAVKDTYEVSLAYGKIDADYSAADGISGGQKEFTFEIESTDADFNETKAPSARAGDTVYLKISSPDVDFLRYKFAVTTCKFIETNGTKDTVSEYKLFDNTLNSCKNNFLDFTMKYCNKTNSFGISHTVFTFDPTQANNYTLTCSIKLCDFDVTDSVAKCNDVESNCGIPTIEPVAETNVAPPDNGPADCKAFGFDLSAVMYYDDVQKIHHTDLCTTESHASRKKCSTVAKGHGAVDGKTMSFKDSTDKAVFYAPGKAPLEGMLLHQLCPNLCVEHIDAKDQTCKFKAFCKSPATLETTVYYRVGVTQQQPCEAYLKMKEDQNAGDAAKICGLTLSDADTVFNVDKVKQKELQNNPVGTVTWLDRNAKISSVCQNACASYGVGADECLYVPQ